MNTGWGKNISNPAAVMTSLASSTKRTVRLTIETSAFAFETLVFLHFQAENAKKNKFSFELQMAVDP